MVDIIIIDNGRSFIVVLVIIIMLKVELLIIDSRCAFRNLARGFTNHRAYISIRLNRQDKIWLQFILIFHVL